MKNGIMKIIDYEITDYEGPICMEDQEEMANICFSRPCYPTWYGEEPEFKRYVLRWANARDVEYSTGRDTSWFFFYRGNGLCTKIIFEDGTEKVFKSPEDKETARKFFKDYIADGYETVKYDPLDDMDLL